ncbi:hypothetical protein ABK905_21560 [Acerihabitans sp. KWT182]|uniref:HTH araC/xylS-type domain-containing protein n=1 Tax=Acerihabitans sp. KWT182 TaxID=3157919 RepID=A0AAU7Q7W9_9GAMM
MYAFTAMMEGASITGMAMDLGSDSVSAFTTMSRKEAGIPPSVFVSRLRQEQRPHVNIALSLSRRVR